MLIAQTNKFKQVLVVGAFQPPPSSGFLQPTPSCRLRFNAS